MSDLGACLRTACFFSSSRAPDSQPHVRPRRLPSHRLPRPASPPPLSSSPSGGLLEIEDCRTAKKILTLHPETKNRTPHLRREHPHAIPARRPGASDRMPHGMRGVRHVRKRRNGRARRLRTHRGDRSRPHGTRPSRRLPRKPPRNSRIRSSGPRRNPHPHRPRQRHAHGPTVRGPGRPADRPNGRKSYRHGGLNGRQNC